MQVSLVSDLHLDISGVKDLILPGGETLLIAGDLCEVKFLQTSKKRLGKFREQLAKYKKVIAVLGNHEHYHSIYGMTADKFQQALPEVTLLEYQAVSITDTTLVFGATLWTDLNKNDPMVELRANTWPDYNNILVSEFTKRKLLPKDTYAAHKRALAYLIKTAEDNPDKEIIVLTHFAPSGKSCSPRFSMSPDNPFFHSSLEDIILSNPNIKVWCHGHTHDRFDYKIGDCRVVCNPRGYQPGFFDEETGFDPSFSFEVK